MATTNVTGTVVRVFKDRSQAQMAIADLKRSGYTQDQIGLVTQNRTDSDDMDSGTQAEEGGMAGAAAGAGLGALWGIGILSNVLPGIGPALFGGTLGVLLSSAAAGAAAAGIVGSLVGLGVSDEDAAYYEGEIKSGRTVVTVNAGADADRVKAILANHGGYSRMMNR